MKPILFLFFTFVSFCTFSQSKSIIKPDHSIPFKVFEKDTLFGCMASGMVNPQIRKHFGGISAIEYLGGNQLILVSDKFKKDKDKSYFFITDLEGSILSSESFYGEDNVESVRINPFLKNYYYSFEKENTTGVGFIDNKKTVNLFTEKLPTPNRGIEGITFTTDSALWVAFESGNSTNCDANGTTTFYKIPYKKSSGMYDYQSRVSFQYPLNRCSCIDNGESFNGNLGNGVSEILAFPNEAGKLLVLERCYNGSKPNGVKLYLAQIPLSPDLPIEKFLVYDLTKAKLEPDNMEGMTWVTSSEGQLTLFLISDDNFNTRNQKTLLIKLDVE